MLSYDVAIIGAGTAGAGAAWQCAKRGLRVVCLDAHPLERAGARWVNGVATWQFDEAGVPRPRGSELRDEDGPFHLIAGRGQERVVLQERGLLEVDMRELVARLQGLAQDAGAELRAGVKVWGRSGDQLDTNAGPLRATYFIDASGLGGTGLMPTPELGSEHICAAAQAVHAVTDPAGARAFFSRHRVPEGETLCFTGIAGGYSILNARLEGDELSILTGSIPADGHPSGKAMLDRFVAEEPWIGDALFGGARAIPLRRPYDRLVEDRVALLGDAGSQVFSAHGSGIGLGLIAGRMLAEALAADDLLQYETRFLREYGGLLAAYDIFRRYSQTFSVADLEALMRAGLLDAAASSSATAQRWPSLDLASVQAKLPGLAQAPARAVALLALASRMAAVASLYRGFPGARSGLVRAWSRAVAALVGDRRPDLL